MVLRKIAAFRAQLAEPERRAFDALMRAAVAAARSGEVEGYGLGEWLRLALLELVDLLRLCREDADDHEIHAVAGVWGIT